MEGGRSSSTRSFRPGFSCPPVTQVTSSGATPYSWCRTPRIQTLAVMAYSGTPMRPPRRSSGFSMPFSAQMYMAECRKIRDGKTGTPTNGESPRPNQRGVGGQGHFRGVELPVLDHPKEYLGHVHVDEVRIDALNGNGPVMQGARAVGKMTDDIEFRFAHRL